MDMKIKELKARISALKGELEKLEPDNEAVATVGHHKTLIARSEGMLEVFEMVRGQLDFARTVGKRLDEHRELVESIEKTSLNKDKPWHVTHMATQDDYLMRLYFLRHGIWPRDNGERCKITGEYVRPRPALLGSCLLPEYSEVS